VRRFVRCCRGRCVRVYVCCVREDLGIWAGAVVTVRSGKHGVGSGCTSLEPAVGYFCGQKRAGDGMKCEGGEVCVRCVGRCV